MNRRPRILLIDDNDNTLDLLEVYLFHDYEIITAENGFEGLKAAQERQPDLIITDIMMPVMDGIAFFNELRRRPETAHIPVLAVTAFAEPTTVKSLRNVGFAGVVPKPFKRDNVLATVSGQVGPSAPDPEAGA
jgi:CheY-like chemotaxis protein